MFNRYQGGAVELTIPVALKNNNEGQTRHFSKSVKEKELFAVTLRSLGMRSTPPDYPQRIVITRILGKKESLWDADSVLRGNAKQLVDSLKDAGFYTDDGPKYISEAFGKQDASQRKNGPAVHVRIERAE